MTFPPGTRVVLSETTAEEEGHGLCPGTVTGERLGFVVVAHDDGMQGTWAYDDLERIPGMEQLARTDAKGGSR